MPKVPSRSAGRAAQKGGSALWPIVISILVLLVGGWALKTIMVDGTTPKNILLMGVDEDKTRTDVVILAHIDPKQGLANFISIPRDTLVDIDCQGLKACETPDKLNHAHAYGGPELTVKAVEKFLGVGIDGYVRVDFEGFKKVVDTLGGVEVVIDQNMYYEDPTPPGLLINFKASKEPQKLDGKKALEYVRFRADGQGDIGRTERTRKFMVATLNTLQKNGNIKRLPELVQVMAPYVKTDIDTATGAALAGLASKVEAEQIQMAMVKGEAKILPSGKWVWMADEAQTQDLVDTLIKNPKPGEGAAK